MSIHARGALNLVIFIVLFMTAACQPTTPAHISAEAKQQDKALEIVEVLIGPASDSASLRPITLNDSIYVTVHTTGKSANAKMLVQVFALANGVVVGAKTIKLDTSSNSRQSFRFHNDSPWEPGRYLVEVTLDGKLASQSELEIYASDAHTQ